MKKLITDF